MNTPCFRKTDRIVSNYADFQHTADSLKSQGRKKSCHISSSQLFLQFSLLSHESSALSFDRLTRVHSEEESMHKG